MQSHGDRSRHSRALLLVGTALAAGLVGAPALSQDTAPPAGAGGAVTQDATPTGGPVNAAQAGTVEQSTAAGGLEEIVVTAQKRAQNLQDVPVAVTALSEATLQVNRITTVQDLTGLAPNVTVRSSAGGSAIPSFTVRGITSFGVVPGSDKQVAINVDGVYLSSTRGALFELPDIERIEVLRGPQGTLFGRNSTAGAVSIVTRTPTGEFGVRQEVSVGNYDQFRTRTSVDLPAVGPFSAYVTYTHNERRGDIRNLGAGTTWDRTAPNSKVGVLTSPRYLGSRNADSVFVAVRFAPSETFRTTYKFDYADEDYTPDGNALIAVNPNTATTSGGPLLAALIANQPAGGRPYGPLALTPDAKRPKAVNNYWTTPANLRSQGHNLTTEFDLGDAVSVRNIAAYRRSYLDHAVSQIGGAGGLTLTAGAVPAYINFLVAAGQPLATATAAANATVGRRFVDVGTNVQNLSKQWSDELQLNYDSELLTFTAGGIYFHSKDRSGTPRNIRTTAALTFFPATGDVTIGSQGVSYNKATSIAAYGQAEVHVTPTLDLVAGGRVTRDRKSGSFVSGGTFVSSVAGCPTTPAATATNPTGVCRTAGTITGTRTDSFVYKKTTPTYSVGVNYKPSNDLLVYAKYSTGYVSGGSIGAITFVPERVRSAEGGIKADFFDRRVRTNLALFHAKYKNVQTAQSGRNVIINGVAQTQLSTAVITGFDEKAYGFEFESSFVPVQGLTLSASLGYTHAKQYNVNPILLNSITLVLANGTAVSATSARPTLLPKWTSNLSAQYESQPLFGEATALARVDAGWRSKYFFELADSRVNAVPQFAPMRTSPASWLVNARVALRNVEVGPAKLEVAVWGRNLNNNRVALFGSGAPYEYGAQFQQARTYGADVIVRF